MRPLVLLALAFLATPFAAHAGSEINAFVASNYDYCDAKVLAAMWETSTSDAKVRIGSKVAGGFTNIVDSELGLARRATEQNPARRCRWYEMPFSYDDAVLLSKYWGSTPSDAKTRAENKAIDGGNALIRQVLVHARAAHPTMDTCHNKLLSGLWGTSPADTTSRYEQKVSTGGLTLVNSILDAARRTATHNGTQCSFADTPYTYGDAADLAKMWGTTPAGAKATIESKYADGNEAYVKSELKRARTVQ